MPVNNFGSNLRVTTNLNGEEVDNDAFVKYKSHVSHNDGAKGQSHTPWAQNYVPPALHVSEEDAQLTPVEIDPKLLEANTQDLRNRNLHQK